MEDWQDVYKTLDMEVEFSDHFVTSVFSSDSTWGGIGPLGWTRPASLGCTGPSGVDSAGPHHFDSIPPAILSGPFCLKVCLRALGSCIVFDTEILLVGAASLSEYVSLALCQFQGRVILGWVAWD